jgi:glycyl-tRNA synthetase beta chain
MSSSLLIEIRTEELPAAKVRSAAEAFRDGVLRRLRAASLLDDPDAAPGPALGTPRRLAVCVDGVRGRGPGRDERVWGPPVAAAFGADGAPTRAGDGFARTVGVELAAMSRGEKLAGKPPYLFVDRTVPGVALADLMPTLLTEVLREIPFRKSMRWPGSTLEFARPVRALLVLHGTDVIPVAIAGTNSGRAAGGHRFLAPGAIEFDRADSANYVRRLREGRVEVDVAERARRVLAEVEGARGRAGGVVAIDASERELLEEVTGLVEWPTALVGSFDDRYLGLPESVLVTSMAHHLRYFPVRNAAGRLLPRFVSVTDREATSSDAIRAGNERVLRARLYDADFFFHRDRRAPLQSFRPRLDGVDYHRGLGTLREKGERVASLAAALGAAAGLSAETLDAAARASFLLKCDLATEVVQEFPELQGIIGASYARMDGEPPSVALALEAQYQPREMWHASLDDDAAALVSLAEKADALAAYFSIGEEPTGSADPFGLRRHALGLLRILAGKRWPLSVDAVLAPAGAGRSVAPEAQCRLLAFVWARAEQEARHHGLVDFVDAVGSLTHRPFHEYRERLVALLALSREECWKDLVALVERTGNMGAAGTAGAGGLPEGEAVAEALRKAREAAANGGDVATFARTFRDLLGAPVAALFDAVLVDDPANPERSAALKALLGDVFALFRDHVGDLRRLGGAARPPRG